MGDAEYFVLSPASCLPPSPPIYQPLKALVKHGVLPSCPIFVIMLWLWFLHLLNIATYASVATSVALNSRQTQWPMLPTNLTEDVLQVANAISPPCADNNTWCQHLTEAVIPSCQALLGDPGCWCGNHDPVHHCAMCMSSPSDNQTTPEQMRAANNGHNAFLAACHAYEQYITSMASTTSTSSMISTTSQTPTPTPTPTIVSSNSSDNKPVPVGPIVGGVVGLVVVIGIVYLVSIVLKRNNRRSDVHPSSVSRMSSEHKSPIVYATPYPQLSANNPSPVPGHISPHNSSFVPSPEPINLMTGVPQTQPPVATV
ncbi:hypothetical protein B0J17DRAFT_719632 [Rhizoctonia solani]|nr:hypothetical protein B0J17DRAFT_719632 [Rhizoctonia solani]